MEKKESNPKDSVGVKKAGLSCVPLPVLFEVGVAMQEGARKYGRHNYRVAGVRASVYVDALFRHIGAWYEGEDIDPDSKLSHVTKAITTLIVLRDSMMQGNWVDDRPPKTIDQEWLRTLNKAAAEVVEMYPNALPAFTQDALDAQVDQENKNHVRGTE